MEFQVLNDPPTDLQLPVAKPFCLQILASADDTDQLGHVNNEVYLKWLMWAADQHSSSLGYPAEKYIELGACFMVRRHEIDYLSQGYKGDEIIIATWPGEIKTASALRHYQIHRLKDGKCLIKALTKWSFVGLKSGRPQKITPELLETFDPAKFI